VGSASVLGLVPKPIIDVDVVIPSRELLPDVIQQLTALGYRHQGDVGVAGREAFASDGVVGVPRDGCDRR
jgi:GrpB-like predicted nucleotidyltransferase (UPF0157 family)